MFTELNPIVVMWLIPAVLQFVLPLTMLAGFAVVNVFGDVSTVINRVGSGYISEDIKAASYV